MEFLDPATGRELKILAGQNAAAFGDGTLVLLRGSKVLFLDPSTLAEIETASRGMRSSIGAQPAFSPDGKWLAFRRGDPEPAQIVILDVQQKRQVKVLSDDQLRMGSALLCPRRIALGHRQLG